MEYRQGEIVLLAIDGNGELSVPIFMCDKNGSEKEAALTDAPVLSSYESRRRPLCVDYNEYRPYIVVLNNNIHGQQEESLPIQENSTSYLDMEIDTIMTQETDLIIPHRELRLPLDYLFETCIYLYKFIQESTDGPRDNFQQVAANARYFHSMLVDEIKQLDRDGVKVMVKGKDQAQLLKELHDRKQQVPELDYRNTCHNTIFTSCTEWDYATSAFFIALPSDLDSWNDSDPLTHQLRFYFLCEHWNQEGAREDLPQHVHLFNHPGYVLRRPAEFFQEYGDYVLRVLRMIKHGYSVKECDIPSLDTFEILWSYDPNTSSNYLTKETIGPLVDKAIAHFEEMSPPRWKKLGLTRDQSGAINQFLDIHDGDKASFHLHRYIHESRYVSWRCEAHAHQFLNKEAMEGLEVFVAGHEGHVDMQQAVLRVELGSVIEANQFRTFLANVNFPFHCVRIKLNWTPTRIYVAEFFRDVSITGPVFLEIDGITLDIHPQGCEQYMTNLFVDIIETTGQQFITLLNYPKAQEQCIHIGKTCLQSTLSPLQSTYRWVDLRSDLIKFVKSFSTAKMAFDCTEVAGELRNILEKHGQCDVSLVTIYQVSWNAVFDLVKGTCVEAYSQEGACPKGILSSGSLHTLVVSLDDLQHGRDFFRTVQNNTMLEYLSVSHRGNNVLQYTDHITRMWRESSCHFHLTFVDRMLDSQGRVFAELAMKDNNGGLSGSGALTKQEASNLPVDIEFVQWDCDHVFSPLSDCSAFFLDMVMKQHPSALKLLTLDVSQLSFVGLGSIRNVLRRSSLDHLHILCSSFDSSVSTYIRDVLGSIEWLTLKSLVLSGDYIDKWLQLWPSPTDARLLCLQIWGTLPDDQELAHSSVLFLHQLIFASPLVELHLKLVQPRENCDWSLIVESLDFSLLEILDVGTFSLNQILVTNAMDLFVSKIEAAHKEKETAKLLLPAFTLDITILKEHSLVGVQKILSLCSVVELCVLCHLFDPRLSDLIAELLGSVQWSTLKILEFFDENLDTWIQLLPPLAAPQLRSLTVCGQQVVHRKLSNSSVLFVQQLVKSGTLEELIIMNAQLQHEHDWALIVENIDHPLALRTEFGGSAHDQYMSYVYHECVRALRVEVVGTLVQMRF